MKNLTTNVLGLRGIGARWCIYDSGQNSTRDTWGPADSAMLKRAAPRFARHFRGSGSHKSPLMVCRRREGTFLLPFFLTQNLAATVIHPYSQTLGDDEWS